MECECLMIPFNKPSITNLEKEYVWQAMDTYHTSGDGVFTKKVYQKCHELLGIEHMLLTTSGTTALEMASLLLDLKSDDEVIVPSFTFSSTANAFLLRGAKPVFCDIRRDTFNMDESKIYDLITKKTKAIYTVDYAGIPCEMNIISEIAKDNNLFVVEDAAQAFGSYYHEKPAGTLGDFGCYSFHETKNYSMGEGGALVLSGEKYLERAEIIREKGTNRRQVLKGMVDKYTWHDIGSSFLPSDVLAAMLFAQLERFDEIRERRIKIWNVYYERLQDLENMELLKRPNIPAGIRHNGHMFNIVLPTDRIRDELVSALKAEQIYAYICYLPLHSSPFGRKLGYVPEKCPITEDYASRTLRLPLYADMSDEEVVSVCDAIEKILKSL